MYPPLLSWVRGRDDCKNTFRTLRIGITWYRTSTAYHVPNWTRRHFLVQIPVDMQTWLCLIPTYAGICLKELRLQTILRALIGTNCRAGIGAWLVISQEEVCVCWDQTEEKMILFRKLPSEWQSGSSQFYIRETSSVCFSVLFADSQQFI